jgi:hypothetical protein
MARFPATRATAAGVKADIFDIWLCTTECIADGLRILRGEQNPHHLATVLVMLKKSPDRWAAPRGRNSNMAELGGLVSALRRAGAAMSRQASSNIVKALSVPVFFSTSARQAPDQNRGR